MEKPHISIIIPTLNEESHIPLLLTSLSTQTERSFEVIISDAHSTDETRNIASSFREKLPSLTVVEHNAKTVGSARNKGAEQATGTYLLFLDADVQIENIFLQSILDISKDKQKDMLTVWNHPSKPSFKGSVVFLLLNLTMAIFQHIKPAANGGCIYIAKLYFDKVKGFDPDIIFGEDFDLVQRAWKAGARFAVYKEPKLLVSPRRFEKEGLIKSFYKSLKAIVYQLFLGPIKKPIFSYEMGGQYYKK